MTISSQPVVSSPRLPVNLRQLIRTLRKAWVLFWMKFAGRHRLGRLATWLATWCAPPHRGRCILAQYNPRGFISPSATVYHGHLTLGRHVFIGDNALIFENSHSEVKLHDRVQLYGAVVIETGDGGSVEIGEETHIQPGCRLMGIVGRIRIGRRVEMAPNCAFYPYNHGIAAGQPIRTQPIVTKGGIDIGDDVWLGYGVVVLDGVQIGEGAVVGAGSIVTRDIPAGAIAVGSPARVVGMRMPNSADKFDGVELPSDQKVVGTAAVRAEK